MSNRNLEERLKNAIKIMCRRNADCAIEIFIQHLAENDQKWTNVLLRMKDFKPHKKQVYLEALILTGLLFCPQRFMLMALERKSVVYPDLDVLLDPDALPVQIKMLRDQSLRIAIEMYSEKEIHCMIKTCMIMKDCSLEP